MVPRSDPVGGSARAESEDSDASRRLFCRQRKGTDSAAAEAIACWDRLMHIRAWLLEPALRTTKTVIPETERVLASACGAGGLPSRAGLCVRAVGRLDSFVPDRIRPV